MSLASSLDDFNFQEDGLLDTSSANEEALEDDPILDDSSPRSEVGTTELISQMDDDFDDETLSTTNAESVAPNASAVNISSTVIESALQLETTKPLENISTINNSSESKVEGDVRHTSSSDAASSLLPQEPAPQLPRALPRTTTVPARKKSTKKLPQSSAPPESTTSQNPAAPDPASYKTRSKHYDPEKVRLYMMRQKLLRAKQRRLEKERKQLDDDAKRMALAAIEKKAHEEALRTQRKRKVSSQFPLPPFVVLSSDESPLEEQAQASAAAEDHTPQITTTSAPSRMRHNPVRNANAAHSQQTSTTTAPPINKLKNLFPEFSVDSLLLSDDESEDTSTQHTFSPTEHASPPTPLSPYVEDAQIQTPSLPADTVTTDTSATKKVVDHAKLIQQLREHTKRLTEQIHSLQERNAIAHQSHRPKRHSTASLISTPQPHSPTHHRSRPSSPQSPLLAAHSAASFSTANADRPTSKPSPLSSPRSKSIADLPLETIPRRPQSAGTTSASLVMAPNTRPKTASQPYPHRRPSPVSSPRQTSTQQDRIHRDLFSRNGPPSPKHAWMDDLQIEPEQIHVRLSFSPQHSLPHDVTLDKENLHQATVGVTRLQEVQVAHKKRSKDKFSKQKKSSKKLSSKKHLLLMNPTLTPPAGASSKKHSKSKHKKSSKKVKRVKIPSVHKSGSKSGEKNHDTLEELHRRILAESLKEPSASRPHKSKKASSDIVKLLLSRSTEFKKRDDDKHKATAVQDTETEPDIFKKKDSFRLINVISKQNEEYERLKQEKLRDALKRHIHKLDALQEKKSKEDKESFHFSNLLDNSETTTIEEAPPSRQKLTATEQNTISKAREELQNLLRMTKQVRQNVLEDAHEQHEEEPTEEESFVEVETHHTAPQPLTEEIPTFRDFQAQRPADQRLSPSSLERKLHQVLEIYDKTQESRMQVEVMKYAQQIAEANQETATLAQILHAREMQSRMEQQARAAAEEQQKAAATAAPEQAESLLSASQLDFSAAEFTPDFEDDFGPSGRAKIPQKSATPLKTQSAPQSSKQDATSQSQITVTRKEITALSIDEESFLGSHSIEETTSDIADEFPADFEDQKSVMSKSHMEDLLAKDDTVQEESMFQDDVKSEEEVEDHFATVEQLSPSSSFKERTPHALSPAPLDDNVLDLPQPFTSTSPRHTAHTTSSTAAATDAQLMMLYAQRETVLEKYAAKERLLGVFRNKTGPSDRATLLKVEKKYTTNKKKEIADIEAAIEKRKLELEQAQKQLERHTLAAQKYRSQLEHLQNRGSVPDIRSVFDSIDLDSNYDSDSSSIASHVTEDAESQRMLQEYQRLKQQRKNNSQALLKKRKELERRRKLAEKILREREALQAEKKLEAEIRREEAILNKLQTTIQSTSEQIESPRALSEASDDATSVSSSIDAKNNRLRDLKQEIIALNKRKKEQQREMLRREEEAMQQQIEQMRRELAEAETKAAQKIVTDIVREEQEEVHVPVSKSAVGESPQQFVHEEQEAPSTEALNVGQKRETMSQQSISVLEEASSFEEEFEMEHDFEMSFEKEHHSIEEEPHQESDILPPAENVQSPMEAARQPEFEELDEGQIHQSVSEEDDHSESIDTSSLSVKSDTEVNEQHDQDLSFQEDFDFATPQVAHAEEQENPLLDKEEAVSTPARSIQGYSPQKDTVAAETSMQSAEIMDSFHTDEPLSPAKDLSEELDELEMPKLLEEPVKQQQVSPVLHVAPSTPTREESLDELAKEEDIPLEFDDEILSSHSFDADLEEEHTGDAAARNETMHAEAHSPVIHSLAKDHIDQAIDNLVESMINKEIHDVTAAAGKNITVQKSPIATQNDDLVDQLTEHLASDFVEDAIRDLSTPSKTDDALEEDACELSSEEEENVPEEEHPIAESTSEEDDEDNREQSFTSEDEEDVTADRQPSLTTATKQASEDQPQASPPAVDDRIEYVTEYVNVVLHKGHLANIDLRTREEPVPLLMDELFLEIEKQRLNKESQQIFNKMIFDCVNEAIADFNGIMLRDQEKKVFLGNIFGKKSVRKFVGSAQTGKFGHSGEDTETNLLNYIQSKLKRLIGLSKDRTGVVPDFALMDMVGASRSANPNTVQWDDFDREEEEIKIEMGDMVFDLLMTDTAQWLQSMMQQ